MFGVIKKILHLPIAVRYAYLVGKSYDAHSEKDYKKALEYLAKADALHPLMDEGLLRRAQLKLRVMNYAGSTEDAKLVIRKINNKNYSEADKYYLIYYACRIGTKAQSALEDIEEEFVDKEFNQVTYGDLQVTEVSSHLLRNFPLKK